MINFRLKTIAFCAILSIGGFNACQFAALGQDLPPGWGRTGKPSSQPGGPRFAPTAEDIDRPPQVPNPDPRPIRGACLTKDQLSFRALVRNNQTERTVSDYPTLFFYLPQTEAESAEFTLLDPSGNQIYQQTLAVKNLSGVIAVSIPANSNVPALEAGKSYTWNFTLICNPTDRAGDLLAIGKVERVNLSADIRSQLEQADAREKIFIYAKNGIWLDALSNLAAARRTFPTNEAIQADWESLLGSVKLSEIAKEPIVQVQTERQP